MVNMHAFFSTITLGPALIRWNQATYQLLSQQGPHGGLWTSLARGLSDWGLFPIAFAVVALFFFGRPADRARLDALAAAGAALLALFAGHELAAVLSEPPPAANVHALVVSAPNSFPNGAAALGAAAAGAFWVSGRRLLAWEALLLVLAAAWGTVVIGGGWPLDVVVGVGVGLLSGGLVGEIAMHLPRIRQLLAMVPLPSWLAVLAAVVAVAVGFALLEERTHLGMAGGPIAIGAVLMAALGVAWSQRPPWAQGV